MELFNLTVVGGSADEMIEISPDTFSGDFEAGTELLLTAHAPEGHEFLGWEYVEEEEPVEPNPPVVLPPHHLTNNPNTLEIDISGRVHISSRADAPFVLVGHDGLTSPPSELARLDHAILDGGVIGGGRAKPRPITLDFVAKRISYPAISSLFPLGRRETIEATRGNVTRLIDGYRYGPIYTDAKTALATPVVSVTFLCPEPYFRNDFVYEGNFSRAEGGLQYPVQYPVKYGTIAGDGSSLFNNRGDYPAPFVLEMTANTDGDLHITIDDAVVARVVDMVANQELVLDTRTKILTIDGQKRFSAFRGSFPTIPVGESRMALVGVSGAATIRYAEIFEGV